MGNNNDHIFVVKECLLFDDRMKNHTEKREKVYVLVSTENLDIFLKITSE